MCLWSGRDLPCALQAYPTWPWSLCPIHLKSYLPPSNGSYCVFGVEWRASWTRRQTAYNPLLLYKSVSFRLNTSRVEWSDSFHILSRSVQMLACSLATKWLPVCGMRQHGGRRLKALEFVDLG